MLHFGRWKLLTIFLVVLAGALYTLPNLVPETVRYQINEADGSREPRGIWRYIPSSTINLGLDLQGGSYIVFEVDMNEVRTAQLESLAADVRQTLRNDPPLLPRSVAVVGWAATGRPRNGNAEQSVMGCRQDATRRSRQA